jgi:hypothetical protein
MVHQALFWMVRTAESTLERYVLHVAVVVAVGQHGHDDGLHDGWHMDDEDPCTYGRQPRLMPMTGMGMPLKTLWCCCYCCCYYYCASDCLSYYSTTWTPGALIASGPSIGAHHRLAYFVDSALEDYDYDYVCPLGCHGCHGVDGNHHDLHD